VSVFLLAQSNNAALWTFFIYTVLVFVLAGFANKLLSERNFLSEYFLGSRGLGMWAFALTFAATSASGGSFTGFPAKIYTHGWILALWISSYMVYPICTMGFMGKRINQVARKTGAITVPDILRDRFESRSFGLLSMFLIVFFLSVNLIAQFKAGSLLLQTLVQDTEIFRSTAASLGGVMQGVEFFDGVNPAYLTCLLLFGVAVILYTTYGGFHAVVWTDVLQGIVMVVGVCILLPLTISQVGGMTAGSKSLAEMVPPRLGTATLELPAPARSGDSLTDLWFVQTQEDEELPRLFRMSGTVSLTEGDSTVEDVKFVELITPSEIERQLDRMQSMEGFDSEILNQASTPDLATCISPGKEHLIAKLGEFRGYEHGAGETGHYISGPGPMQPPADPTAEPASDPGFLPLSMAISFYFMWAISGTGQPHYMVRLMSFKDATTLRRAIMTVTVYFGLIYFPLVMIFCYSRILLPGMENEADKIMPLMAVTVTENAGAGWLAGILVAAPFAAVMSTVDSILLVISSAVVRDFYQRNINPDASEKTIKRLSYWVTLLVGAFAMFYAINPPKFLQDLVIYTGSGLAACFLFPVVAAVYWPRSNLPGCITGMLAGFGSHLLMHILGSVFYGEFTRPYNLFGCSPIIVGFAASLLTILIVTPLTPAPSEELVRRYFCKSQTKPA